MDNNGGGEGASRIQALAQAGGDLFANENTGNEGKQGVLKTKIGKCCHARRE